MIERLILRIKRGDTRFTRLLRQIARGSSRASLPLPRFLNPWLRLLFNAHRGIAHSIRRGNTFLFREPLFRGRCEAVSKRFSMNHLPFVQGHAKIYLGDDVSFFGDIGIHSGRIFDEPVLTIGNRVSIGHLVQFTVNQAITIEDDVFVSSGVTVMDSDGHPRDARARIAHMPPGRDEIRPVRICRRAWIGNNVWIMKGVTIGEGAIVGASSVVLADVPPYCVAMGNPARVILKNLTPFDASPVPVTD